MYSICTSVIRRSKVGKNETTLTIFHLTFSQYLVFLDPEYKLLDFEGTQLLFIYIQTLDTRID
jgi:hypothetical protein